MDGAMGVALVSLLLVGCAGPVPLEPTAFIAPIDFQLQAGWRAPASARLVSDPTGEPLANQAFLRVDVRGIWDVPTPEPDVRCVIMWTWDDPPTAAPVPHGVELGDAVWSWRFVLDDASTATTNCPLRIPAEALVAGDVVIGVGASTFARWQDAVADLPPDVPAADVQGWPWLDNNRLLGATLAIVAADDAVRSTRPGVAIAALPDDRSRLSESGGGLLTTRQAAPWLQAPSMPPSFLRAATIQPFVLDHALADSGR